MEQWPVALERSRLIAQSGFSACAKHPNQLPPTSKAAQGSGPTYLPKPAIYNPTPGGPLPPGKVVLFSWLYSPSGISNGVNKGFCFSGGGGNTPIMIKGFGARRWLARVVPRKKCTSLVKNSSQYFCRTF